MLVWYTDSFTLTLSFVVKTQTYLINYNGDLNTD